jgi:hypothetical protein
MKRTIAIICILAAGLMLTVSSVWSAPNLVIPEGEFNFGWVPQHSKVSHTFELKNLGDDTLRITRVIPGCGCTKAPLNKDVLAVGETAELEIIFSTGRYNGKVSKSPKVETNEGRAPKRVRIISNVTSRPDSTTPLVMNPYKLDISQSGEKTRDRITFTISNVSDEDLNIELIAFPYTLAEINLPRKVKAGSHVEAEVVVLADALKGEFTKSMTIQVDDADKTRFTIPITRKTHSKQAAIPSK